MGKFSNKITGGIRNVPISQRQRVRVTQMLDVIGDPQDGDTLVYNESLGAFEYGLSGGIYGENYDSASFTVGSGTTNYNVESQQATLFDSVPSAKYLRITTSANIDLKINNTGEDAIAITTTESPFEMAYNGITNLFITTAGSAANIRIVLIG